MKTVFVTGADRGIGFALAKKFVQEGYRVLCGQFIPEWNELAGLKEAYPEQLHLLPLDVGDTASVQKACDISRDITEKIDILINCAGIAANEDNGDTVFATMNINAVGALRVTELFLPMMQSGMKRICFVSSEAGSIAQAHRTDNFAYCMSKSALNMAVRLMFRQLRPQGYTFRLYHPGWVKSYMMGKLSEQGVYTADETAIPAFQAFSGHCDYEDVLMMTDVKSELWAF